jgi:hypothetical protein
MVILVKQVGLRINNAFDVYDYTYSDSFTNSFFLT